MLIALFDKESGARLGAVDEATWARLTSILQKENPDDADYWIDAATLELLEAEKLPDVVAILRAALGSGEGLEVSWREEG